MNKLRYNVSFWLGALFLFVTGGCSDYFDVRPKSQVLADELFSTEEGFSDQFPVPSILLALYLSSSVQLLKSPTLRRSQ